MFILQATCFVSTYICDLITQTGTKFFFVSIKMKYVTEIQIRLLIVSFCIIWKFFCSRCKSAWL